MTTTLSTTINGTPSDTVPVQNGQLCDALYDLFDRVGATVTREYVTAIETAIARGDRTGCVFLGVTSLEWSLT